ncbi:M64 family metallopeptidase [Duganella sp. HH101]|uniref:M64 family metallopeptidase n=1 Tax=Duganella sp. HH101 TaxID=1781066 RepID=UPI00087352D2|nr:M64 family metallopeptidase [Duganella sp. HH101]OFA02353.1 aqualysin-1 precursor [Duganella sp. HH101]
MTLLRISAALAALLATGAASADNISLRLAYADGRSGAVFSARHAEIGDFALTPDVRGESAGAQWRVVARDAQGAILHQVTVAGAQQRHVEAFNPATGAIDISATVRQASGTFEVSLPFDSATASVEVVPVQAASARGGKSATVAAAAIAPAALARFDRATLVKLAASSRSARAAAVASTTNATTILSTGPAATRMDYVFIGDGYTAAEMGKWHTDAKKVIDGFLADPLFAANRNALNIRRVDVVSNQSGVDEPDKGIYRDTALDAAFNCYNIDRLLCVDTDKVHDVVGSVLAPDERDVIVVVANSTRYGGSGGEVATLSMATQSIEIALHEIGHTAFSLADEYDYGTCSLDGEPGEPDVTMNATRTVKWRGLISGSTPVPTAAGVYPNGTVGVFQGAQYCTSGKYRPTENSRMRTLGYPWHAVNEGAARKVFAQYSGGGSGVTQTGTVAAGGSINIPNVNPGWIRAAAGNISLQLNGKAGTSYQLYLYQYGDSGWVQVASSAGGTSSPAISYSADAGYYYAMATAVSGGAYTLTYSYTRP